MVRALHDIFASIFWFKEILNIASGAEMLRKERIKLVLCLAMT